MRLIGREDEMDRQAIDVRQRASSLSLRFAALLAANVQNGPDLGILQKIWSATVPCLNEFLLDTFPVTLLAGASQLHSGLIHF